MASGSGPYMEGSGFAQQTQILNTGSSQEPPMAANHEFDPNNFTDFQYDGNFDNSYKTVDLADFLLDFNSNEGPALVQDSQPSPSLTQLPGSQPQPLTSPANEAPLAATPQAYPDPPTGFGPGYHNPPASSSSYEDPELAALQSREPYPNHIQQPTPQPPPLYATPYYMPHPQHHYQPDSSMVGMVPHAPPVLAYGYQQAAPGQYPYGIGISPYPPVPQSFRPHRPYPPAHRSQLVSAQRLLPQNIPAPEMPPPPRPRAAYGPINHFSSAGRSSRTPPTSKDSTPRQHSPSSSDSTVVPANGKVCIDRRLKRKGDPKTIASYYYTKGFPRPEAWGDRVKFIYTEQGQWEESLVFNAAQLKYYLDSCPRPLTIWVQNAPAQCNNRIDSKDRKCRWANCPVSTRSIQAGWHRVAFDEFAAETSSGDKDPFKVAGAMHLWCFEQCFDPVDLYYRHLLRPDKRDFPREQRNPMALTRDNNKDIIHGAFKPWMKKHRDDGKLQAPRAPHSETLAYALVKFHLEHQTSGRQNTRRDRNQNKPISMQKTMDIHMGDLKMFASRSKPRRKQSIAWENHHNPQPQYDDLAAMNYNMQDFEALAAATAAPMGVPGTLGEFQPLTAPSEVPAFPDVTAFTEAHPLSAAPDWQGELANVGEVAGFGTTTTTITTTTTTTTPAQPPSSSRETSRATGLCIEVREPEVQREPEVRREPPVVVEIPDDEPVLDTIEIADMLTDFQETMFQVKDKPPNNKRKLSLNDETDDSLFGSDTASPTPSPKSKRSCLSPEAPQLCLPTGKRSSRKGSGSSTNSRKSRGSQKSN